MARSKSKSFHARSEVYPEVSSSEITDIKRTNYHSPLTGMFNTMKVSITYDVVFLGCGCLEVGIADICSYDDNAVKRGVGE